VDRVGRGVIGQREDAADLAREGLRRRRRAHQRERDLLLPLPPKGDELIGREDEADDDRGRPDQVERDLQLDRDGVPPPGVGLG